MKKRFLSALLAMAMVLTMLPMSAFAVDGGGATQEPTLDKLYVGLSESMADLKKDIKDETGLDATVEESDTAQNLLWFVMTDLAAKDTYQLSVQHNNAEILTKNAISYEEPSEDGKIGQFTPDGAKHLLFVSLDQNSENGQINSEAIKSAEANAEIELVVTINHVETATQPETKATELYATKTIKITKSSDGKWSLVKEPVTPPADEAAIGELKFFADGAKANAVLNKTDSERATMIVPFSGLAQDTTYALTLVYPDGVDHTMSGNAIPINGEEGELIANPVATAGPGRWRVYS